jgi:hypothetical protein
MLSFVDCEGSWECFARTSLKTCAFPISASQVARITGVSHHIWLEANVLKPSFKNDAPSIYFILFVRSKSVGLAHTEGDQSTLEHWTIYNWVKERNKFKNHLQFLHLETVIVQFLIHVPEYIFNTLKYIYITFLYRISSYDIHVSETIYLIMRYLVERRAF